MYIFTVTSSNAWFRRRLPFTEPDVLGPAGYFQFSILMCCSGAICTSATSNGPGTSILLSTAIRSNREALVVRTVVRAPKGPVEVTIECPPDRQVCELGSRDGRQSAL